MNQQEIVNTNNVTTNPFISDSTLSQIMILYQSDLSPEEKTVYALSLLNEIKDSDELSDSEKLKVYIYLHQKKDLQECLLQVVKEFIHYSIDKMKLYVLQRQRDKYFKGKMQSYVVLTNPFKSRADEIEFQNWSGLENDQASFHQWLAKTRAIRASLEPRDYESSD